MQRHCAHEGILWSLQLSCITFLSLRQLKELGTFCEETVLKELGCVRLHAQERSLTPAAGNVVQRPLDWPTPAPGTIEMLDVPRAHQPHSGAHPLLKMVFVAAFVANSSLLPAARLQITPHPNKELVSCIQERGGAGAHALHWCVDRCLLLGRTCRWVSSEEFKKVLT